MQLTYMDIYLHRARMLDINGQREEAIALYKQIIQYLITLQKQNPQYADYYSQYLNLVFEEAEAIRNVTGRREDQQQSTVPPRLPNKPTSTDKPGLSMDDVRYAALGVGAKVKQFDQEYGVSEKCKQAAHTCTEKAKELDREYEIRKKAAEFGQQVKEWDERNGVSKAVISGVKQVASSVGGAIKGLADQSRQENHSQM
ncbi:hypothetical protein JH06_0704 [Blastocystis sp. subtype 4]|uniref:hypothetical protein n=1 Tax=Blastocystis sp. subtype 4 TaxID=944170 RepID=UPI0007115A95|nr:hypothetical protein JH06_0704 [Blastocystis sp. subtype 4]KNB45643.1 hypothetical protein JH06_0704 [Blastocystis sp. subtype 4]|eukprot:XP_014529086.1 hypothetical protein JH06_0704 [Blastocystis sp. subtype 4]